MTAIWDIIIALVGIATSGTAYLAKMVSLRPSPKVTPGVDPIVAALQDYGHSLKVLATIAILTPLPIFILGICLDKAWITASAGIWCALWLGIIALTSSPLGILIEAITGGIKGSATRYVSLVKNALYVELAVTLLVAVLPIRNNLAAIPVIIVAAAVLLLLGNTGMFKKVITKVALATVVFLTLSFIFPWIPSAAKKGMDKVNVTAGNVISGAGESQPGQAASAPMHTYDFKDVRAPKTLVVWYYKGRIIEVILPVGVTVRKDFGNDVHIYYPMDKLSVIVEKGKHVPTPGGLKRTIFWVTGLVSEGTMTVYLEKN